MRMLKNQVLLRLINSLSQVVLRLTKNFNKNLQFFANTILTSLNKAITTFNRLCVVKYLVRLCMLILIFDNERIYLLNNELLFIFILYFVIINLFTTIINIFISNLFNNWINPRVRGGGRVENLTIFSKYLMFDALIIFVALFVIVGFNLYNILY